MKSYGRVLWFATILICVLGATAFAIRPSGPGINTKANSLSVAVATDQPAVAVNDTPSNAVAGIRTANDGGTMTLQNCKAGLWIETALDGGLVFSPYGNADAATTVTLGSVPAGRMPIATQRVDPTGTSVGVFDCLNP